MTCPAAPCKLVPRKGWHAPFALALSGWAPCGNETSAGFLSLAGLLRALADGEQEKDKTMRQGRMLAAISGTVHEEASGAASQAAAGPPGAALTSRTKPPTNSFVRFHHVPPGADVTLVEHGADAHRVSAPLYPGSAGAQPSDPVPHLERSIAGKSAPLTRAPEP
jgi:hypothetical protein